MTTHRVSSDQHWVFKIAPLQICYPPQGPLFKSCATWKILEPVCNCWNQEPSFHNHYAWKITGLCSVWKKTEKEYKSQNWTIKKACKKQSNHTHTIHVWYIYLHLVDVDGKCRYSRYQYIIHGCYFVYVQETAVEDTSAMVVSCNELEVLQLTRLLTTRRAER